MRRFIFKLISREHKVASARKDPRVHQEARRSLRVSVSFVLKDWKFMFFSMFSGVEKTFWSQKCLIVLRYHHTEIRRKASWSNLLDPALRLIASNLYFDLSVSQKKPPHCPNKPPHLYISEIKLKIYPNSSINQRSTMFLMRDKCGKSTRKAQESISSMIAVQFSRKSLFRCNSFEFRQFSDGRSWSLSTRDSPSPRKDDRRNTFLE